MKNFEFRGKQIQGGQLAGHIVIATRVASEIRDVTFAPDTVIQGKLGQGFVMTKLVGVISGDVTAPAKLENVTVSAGTQIDHVIVGEGTILEAGVILGKNVTSADGKPIEPTGEETDSLDDETLACKESNALGLDKNGDEVKDLKACFAVQPGKEHVEISMQVDPTHVGQKADLLLVIKVSPTEWYSLDKTKWKAWNGNLDSLKAKDSFEKLPESITLELANSEFSELGNSLTLFVGYELQDGTVVYNQGESL